MCRPPPVDEVKRDLGKMQERAGCDDGDESQVSRASRASAIRMTRDWRFYLWKFVHNGIIHPLMSLPINEPAWLCRAHDWTAERCKGAG